MNRSRRTLGGGPGETAGGRIASWGSLGTAMVHITGDSPKRLTFDYGRAYNRCWSVLITAKKYMRIKEQKPVRPEEADITNE